MHWPQLSQSMRDVILPLDQCAYHRNISRPLLGMCCVYHSSTPTFRARAQFTHIDIQCESKKSPLRFSDIFTKQSEIFIPNFTGLLYFPIYARWQIFTQLSLTVTNFCILSATIQRTFRPMVDILSIWCELGGGSCLIWHNHIWHNFAKLVDNWIKICSLV